MRFSAFLFMTAAVAFASAATTDDENNNNVQDNQPSSNLRRKAYILPEKKEKVRVFVQYKPGRKTQARSLLNRRSSTTKMLYDFTDLDSFVVTTDQEGLAELKANPDIENIINDEKRYPQYMKDSVRPRKLQANNGQTIPEGINLVNAPEVWPISTGKGVKVCVIDTGIDAEHEDFATDLLTGLEGIQGLPWDTDAVGHGTHCSGTIAATDDNKGVVGVAPDAAIHTVRVFGDNGGFAYSSGLVDAALQCEAAGARIISMSLGGPVPNIMEFLSFRNLYNRGILTVAAAGNSGNFLFSFPASYAGVMSVAATDFELNKAPFSQFNFQVDIAAPGVDVLSTFPTNAPCSICEAIGEYQYGTISGTSMATPHVAGVAALIWSAFPDLTAEELTDVLEQSATDLGSPGKDNRFGWGLVNAAAAFQYLNGN